MYKLKQSVSVRRERDEKPQSFTYFIQFNHSQMPLFSSSNHFFFFGDDFIHRFVTIALKIAAGCAWMFLPCFQTDPTEIVFALNTFDMIASYKRWNSVMIRMLPLEDETRNIYLHSFESRSNNSDTFSNWWLTTNNLPLILLPRQFLWLKASSTRFSRNLSRIDWYYVLLVWFPLFYQTNLSNFRMMPVHVLLASNPNWKKWFRFEWDLMNFIPEVMSITTVDRFREFSHVWRLKTIEYWCLYRQRTVGIRTPFEIRIRIDESFDIEL